MGKLLGPLILVGACFVGSFLVGMFMARRQVRTAALSRADRRELSYRRAFMDELHSLTIQHAMLNDNFAIIVGDMYEEYRKKSVREQ